MPRRNNKGKYRRRKRQPFTTAPAGGGTLKAFRGYAVDRDIPVRRTFHDVTTVITTSEAL